MAAVTKFSKGACDSHVSLGAWDEGPQIPNPQLKGQLQSLTLLSYMKSSSGQLLYRRRLAAL